MSSGCPFSADTPRVGAPQSPPFPTVQPAWLHSLTESAWPTQTLELAIFLLFPTFVSLWGARGPLLSRSMLGCRNPSSRIHPKARVLPLSLAPHRERTQWDTGQGPGSWFAWLRCSLALLLRVWESLFCLKRQEALLARCPWTPPLICSIVYTHQAFLFPLISRLSKFKRQDCLALFFTVSSLPGDIYR